MKGKRNQKKRKTKKLKKEKRTSISVRMTIINMLDIFKAKLIVFGKKRRKNKFKKYILN